MSQTNTCCPCDPIQSLKLPLTGITLDVDASVLTGGGAGNWEQSLESNGWVKLPNGLMIQWGNYETTATNLVTVAFPKPFPTACFTAVANFYDANGYADIGVYSLAAEHVVIQIDTNKSGSRNFRWIALGH